MEAAIEAALDKWGGDNDAMIHATLLSALATTLLASKVDDIRWLIANDPRRA